MGNKITFFAVNNAGSRIRQASVSRNLIIFGMLFIAFGIILSGVVFYDYYHIKTSVNSENLNDKISNQKGEITAQRRQIQKFADEINVLKAKQVILYRFEEKIRIIANIEKTADHDTVFGVGGSIPENLNSEISLKKKHNSLLREMHEQVGQLNQASVKQKEGLETLLEYLKDQRNILASTPAVRPATGWITSRFGYRKSPFTGLEEFHNGLDISTQEGTPVIATADGIVTFVGKKGELGKMVIIDHGHGMITRYAHLEKASTKSGKAIKRGDIIGEVGNSGRSTGPHLHYDVRLNGVSVNPEKYILD